MIWYSYSFIGDAATKPFCQTTKSIGSLDIWIINNGFTEKNRASNGDVDPGAGETSWWEG